MCFVKGSPVHHTSRVISVHLMYVLIGVTCTPYVCVDKRSPAHLMYVLKRVTCTPYVCVIKGSPVHHTSVLLGVISVHLIYVLLRGQPVHHTSMSGVRVESIQ